MAYVALYRAYRPKSFDEVAGQQVIIKTLQNAIIHEKIGHAYLFSGPRGTGKTSIAKIFAKAVNCLQPISGSPCNACDVCKGIDRGDIPDVIEIDAASNNGVDEIRELRDRVKYMPSIGKYKVYIIDEVHMLTTGAFNALLKTLEEPPKHVIFILATTEIHKIPATILSRCQRFDFKNIDIPDTISKLKEVSKKENITITDEAIHAIALNAEGGLRDALSLLDQTISFAGTKIDEHAVHQVSGSVSKAILKQILEALATKKIADALMSLNDLLAEGKEPTRIVNDLILGLRDLLLEKTTDVKKGFHLENITIEKIYYFLDILSELQQDMKWTHQKRAYIEIAMIKMTKHQEVTLLDQQGDIQQLKQMIFELKDQLKNQKTPISSITPETKNPLVTSSDLEAILNHPDKDKKEQLLKAWPKLASYDKAGLKATAYLLSKGELVAVSNTMLLVYDDLISCEQMMSSKIKEQVFKIVNQKSALIKDIKAIQRSDWDQVLEEFMAQWKQGNKTPRISNRDYQLYEVKKTKKRDKQDLIDLSIEYFGSLVKIKE